MDLFITNRTLLRPLLQSDLENIHQLHHDAETKKYSWVSHLMEKSDIEAWICDQQNLNNTAPGNMAILDRAKNCFIGIMGLNKRSEENTADITYRILPQFRRQGFASESASRLIQAGFETYGLESIVAQVHFQNVAGLAMMPKLGFLFQQRQGIWETYIRHSASL